MAPSVVDWARAPEASNTITVRARQKRTTDFSIRLILMEVFSLSFIDDTSRTHAHLRPSGGGVEGPRHSGGRSYWPQSLFSTATNIPIYGLSFITGITCIEAKPCGKLWRAGSNNFNERQHQECFPNPKPNHWRDANRRRLTRYESTEKRMLQVRLAPRHRRALESRCHV